MKQRLLLVTLTAIAIAISLTGFTTSLATISTPSLGLKQKKEPNDLFE
jgi:hypothetical protein